MSEKILKSRLRNAVKTEAEWKAANPVLLNGESVYSSDTKRWKTGNGTSKWSDLAYDVATPASHSHTPMSLGGGIGTCATAEATVAKAATLSGYSLVTGGIVAIRFTYAVPASSTLNINGKGAKPIFYHNAALIADVIAAGDTVTFIYDGTNYHILSIDHLARITQTVENTEDSVPTGAAVLKKVNNMGDVYLKFRVLSTFDE